MRKIHKLSGGCPQIPNWTQQQHLLNQRGAVISSLRLGGNDKSQLSLSLWKTEKESNNRHLLPMLICEEHFECVRGWCTLWFYILVQTATPGAGCGLPEKMESESGDPAGQSSCSKSAPGWEAWKNRRWGTQNSDSSLSWNVNVLFEEFFFFLQEFTRGRQDHLHRGFVLLPSV